MRRPTTRTPPKVNPHPAHAPQLRLCLCLLVPLSPFQTMRGDEIRGTAASGHSAVCCGGGDLYLFPALGASARCNLNERAVAFWSVGFRAIRKGNGTRVVWDTWKEIMISNPSAIVFCPVSQWKLKGSSAGAVMKWSTLFRNPLHPHEHAQISS